MQLCDLDVQSLSGMLGAIGEGKFYFYHVFRANSVLCDKINIVQMLLETALCGKNTK